MTGDVRQTGDWLVTLAGRVTGLGDTNGDTGHQLDDQTGDTYGRGHLCWDINGHIISLAGGREEDHTDFCYDCIFLILMFWDDVRVFAVRSPVGTKRMWVAIN